MKNLRTEYPQPQFEREAWQLLNGEWDFLYDREDIGERENWHLTFSEQQQCKINVPFVYQTKLSGIHNKESVEVVWYQKKFELQNSSEEIILHFGAVDYHAKIFLNGVFIGEHTGGHTPFDFNITNNCQIGEENTLVVRVFDPLKDEEILRGKQFWEETPRDIWYTQSTGIWQSVWLEYVSKSRLEKTKITSNIDTGMVNFDLFFTKESIGKKYQVDIQFQGTVVISATGLITNERMSCSFDILQGHVFRGTHHGDTWLWSPEQPNLFDVKIILLDTKKHDEVSTYFGMRKVHTKNGVVFLNNKPYYQRLVLDQGYWADGLMSAPTDEDYRHDIEVAKKLGFNGCRKHQKLEDPRFLYWADKLGYLVWGEMASAMTYSDKYVYNAVREWNEVVERDYNHPSIICWVPLNESWGVSEIGFDSSQQHHAVSLFHYLKSLDLTRLVVNNDGWELTVTDICAVHNYMHGNDDEAKKQEYFRESLSTKAKILQSMPAGRQIYAGDFKHREEPILLTEFGGIGFQKDAQIGWGYTSVTNEEAFLKQLDRVVSDVISSPVIFGFCYTQLYDVEEEINGLLTYGRELKTDEEKIRKIFSQFHKNEASE